MTLSKYFPNFDLSVDDYFGFPPKWSCGCLADWSPAVDIKEEDSGYLIKVELPGIEKDDVGISMENGILTITGEKKKEDENYNHVERFHGKFSRSFRVGDTIDFKKISAEMKNGILDITLPKSEKAEIKKIPVK